MAENQIFCKRGMKFIKLLLTRINHSDVHQAVALTWSIESPAVQWVFITSLPLLLLFFLWSFLERIGVTGQKVTELVQQPRRCWKQNVLWGNCWHYWALRNGAQDLIAIFFAVLQQQVTQVFSFSFNFFSS